jgi:hypothetical protein
MSSDPSVVCWSSSSGQPTMAVVGMLCLFFFVLTSHVLAADAGVIVDDQDDNLDIRSPQVRQAGAKHDGKRYLEDHDIQITAAHHKSSVGCRMIHRSLRVSSHTCGECSRRWAC